MDVRELAKPRYKSIDDKYPSPCINCDKCVKACPSGAILGVSYYDGIKREEMFSPSVCSEYMKKAYQKIGRGAVCGICMQVCPAYNKK